MKNPGETIYLNTPEHALNTVPELRESTLLAGPKLRVQWYASFTGQIVGSQLWPGLFPTESEQVDFTIEVGRETHDLRHLPISFQVAQVLRFDPQLALALEHTRPIPRPSGHDAPCIVPNCTERFQHPAPEDCEGGPLGLCKLMHEAGWRPVWVRVHADGTTSQGYDPSPFTCFGAVVCPTHATEGKFP